MIRWSIRSPWLIPKRHWTAQTWTIWRNSKPLFSSRPLCSTNRRSDPVLLPEYNPTFPFDRSIFNTIQRPAETDEWIALLDRALPAHLRLSDGPSIANLDAEQLAEVLLTAQYPTGSFFHDEGVDLLFHLGFNQGRWSAVVWLVKCLVENFPICHSKTDLLSEIVNSWPGKLPLQEETSQPVQLDISPQGQRSRQPSLDELTFGPLDTSRHRALIQHNALGQIWRSLGTMTQACAGGDIRAEVLELLAYIHHHGFMPEAIYRYNVHPSNYVTQQPPLLPLLSSRILTSLSDAAWRAHETLVIEEARAKDGGDASLPPELPGSVYRVNIAGLRPEVWMELILWSSLHGGWLYHGIAILRDLVKDKSGPVWKPLSWREYEDQLALSAKPNSVDWETLDYVFKTEDVSAMSDKTNSSLTIERTVSAEVVNAYIDAIVNTVCVGVGHRGLLSEQIIRQLHHLRKFLSRSNLTISNGSWDALIVRLMDYPTSGTRLSSGTLQGLSNLSPGIGQGLLPVNAKSLPAYVFDGNMAIQGLLHRAMNDQILADNFEGAMAVFRVLQMRTDKERRVSLANFLTGRSSSPLSSRFKSDFPGIDYPALDLGIPPVILGRFLDLVTSEEAYEFGKWLLYNQDVDGPIIEKRYYQNSAVKPAVVRFAVETDDKALLSHFRGDATSMDTLRSLFDSQVKSRQWDTATRILDSMRSLDRHSTWSLTNLCNLSKAMMQISPAPHSEAVEVNQSLLQARTLFSDMVRGRHDGLRRKSENETIQTLLWVLSMINSEWAEYCADLVVHRGPVRFGLGATAFNVVLRGVAEVYGSADAQRILEKVWPQSARDAQKLNGSFPDEEGRMRMPKQRFNADNALKHHRIPLDLTDTSSQAEDAVLLGALDPFPSTIHIIFRRALQELQSDSDLPVHEETRLRSLKVISWTLHRFDEMQLKDSEILREIDRALSDQDLQHIKAEFPILIERLRKQVLAENEDYGRVQVRDGHISAVATRDDV